jgi:hypothetical protein
VSSQALLGVPWKPIVAGGATFDGTNDYMLRGAGLSGVVDGKSGILSCWIFIPSTPGAQMAIIFSANIAVQVTLSTARQVSALVTDGLNGVHILNATALTTGAWHHWLGSWDVAVGASHVYVDDVSDKQQVTNFNVTLDYTATDWGIGATDTGAQRLNASLAELYFAPNQFFDFSVTANRRKFITETKRPMLIGSDGSTPTGTAPAIYQKLVVGEAVANFATNRGSGGNFTISGTLDAASTSPSG